MKPHPLLYAIAALALTACRGPAAPQEKLPRPPQRDAFGRSTLPLLDPASTTPLVLNPTVTPPADANWQLLDTAGGEFDMGNTTLNFSPRSAIWRFTLTSDKTPQATAKPNQDHSYLKVNLWIGEKDAEGKVGLRPVKVDFRRKGGASCNQEFDNGLWPDGTPRPFRITISGTYVTYLARVEDLGPTASTAPKSPSPSN